jgi:lipoprotein NlpI
VRSREEAEANRRAEEKQAFAQFFGAAGQNVGAVQAQREAEQQARRDKQGARRAAIAGLITKAKELANWDFIKATMRRWLLQGSERAVGWAVVVVVVAFGIATWAGLQPGELLWRVLYGQSDLATCKKAALGDEAIAACGRVIASGKVSAGDLVSAYVERCINYDFKGDYDRAIADCTEAIRLNPKYAPAFGDRGDAHYHKGDYDRAIADDTEAIRLDPKYALSFSGRGDAYLAKQNYDRAIADYNEAIRLDPKYFWAFNSRGIAYFAKQDYDRAIADYTEAIRLDPKYDLAYVNRGDVYYHAKQDYDRAMVDYNEAIKVNPKTDFGYLHRGFAYLYSGALDKALADVSQASEFDQKSGTLALWVDIVRQRNNLPSRLPQAISKIDMTAWPAPVIRLYLGQLTPAALLAAANDPDASKKKGRVCDANFYSGQLAFRRGTKDEAVRLFQLAARDCPKTSHEWLAANAELKALGLAR